MRLISSIFEGSVLPGSGGYWGNPRAVRRGSLVVISWWRPVPCNCENITNNLGFRPGLTQIRLCSHKRLLKTANFGFRKKRNCTIPVAKTKTLISFAVTAKLIPRS